MTAHPWPFPGDNVTDRARRVARSYRDTLLHHAPEQCRELDEQMTKLGQVWVVPQVQTITAGQWVTLREAGTLVGRARNTIRDWINEGSVKSRLDGKVVRVLVDDVLDTAREKRAAG